jgi:predicted tellurium resistance membrane protein TerC
VVLGIVGVKLLVEDLVKIAPLPSLGIIGAALAGGIAVSLAADRRGAQARKKTNPSTT